MQAKQEPGMHGIPKRSPQHKIVDNLISSLFPSTQVVLVLVAIIFRDMERAYSLFQESSKENLDRRTLPPKFIRQLEE
jgi:hypothetical protein